MYPASTTGFHDVKGNVWEWHEDHFNGLPGTTNDYLYEDFSNPTYDGRHNVILVIFNSHIKTCASKSKCEHLLIKCQSF